MSTFPNIFDRAKAYEDGKNGEIRPSTNIVINTNRLWYGKNTTVSAFLATAYDKHGNKVNSMDGYFLEPKTDYDRAKIEGDDKAIMYGGYNVVPKSKGQRFEWYVDNVPRRTGIAIHSGVDSTNTSGCLLPAESFTHNKNTDDYSVIGSKKKKRNYSTFSTNMVRME